MVSKDSPIKIPVIPHGLRQEETIVRIAAALDNINTVVSDVFEQIESNIHRHRQYLASLQKRSAVIASKVDLLARKNVVTTVYSPHKFPFAGYDTSTLFEMRLKRPQTSVGDVPIRSRFQHAKYNKIPNKLQFFHVKPNAAAAGPADGYADARTGLGGLPPEIKNVDSLFLFNSAQNVYDKYVMLDALSLPTTQTTARPPPPGSGDPERADIAAAPLSIAEGAAVFRNEDYFHGFYTPTFEEVPSIDVPVDLPRLPGIAGHLEAGAVGAPTSAAVAPSSNAAADRDLLESRSPATTTRDVKSKSVDEITGADLPVISRRAKQPVASAGETAPPDAATAVDDGPASAAAQPPSAAAPPSSIPPPPPPPPPPPMPVDDVAEGGSKVAQKAATAPPPQVNVHTMLMEAIRKAGGKEKARLRPVESTAADGQASSSNDAGGGGDVFMNELWTALVRRRKGISGQNKEHKNVGIMDRVSAMIDPDVDESDDGSGENDGDDWEDSS